MDASVVLLTDVAKYIAKYVSKEETSSSPYGDFMHRLVEHDPTRFPVYRFSSSRAFTHCAAPVGLSRFSLLAGVPQLLSVWSFPFVCE